MAGEGNGIPLQYSCLENPMEGGAWWAAVHGVAKSGHDWATSLSLFPFMHWRRKQQPTPVFLPGESQGGGAWWAATYGVAQSRTQLKRLSSSNSSSRELWHRCCKVRTRGRWEKWKAGRIRFPVRLKHSEDGVPGGNRVERENCDWGRGHSELRIWVGCMICSWGEWLGWDRDNIIGIK